MPTGQLMRSKNDRMIAGVCGGFAKWIGWDPTAVRILYTLVTIFTAFSGTIVYIILAILMPVEGDGEGEV